MIKKLEIDLSKEYRLRIEEIDELAQSFFSDIYKQAFKQVEDIVKWTNEYKENEKDYDFKRESREYNNILAFTGERGTGKSSAMLTVAKTLISSNDKSNKIDIGNGKTLNYDTRFETLHTIDPSRFEQDQNIIEVIIAELFEKFQDKIKTETGKDSEKRKVLKAFQDVYKCLKTISQSSGFNRNKYEGDPLEALAKLADGTKMEDNMRNLINLYLQYFHPKQAENASVLIIPIDDFDLNVEHAGEMAEQIRKYLMIPQVLVLMAVNMEQFGDVKTQEVIKDFKLLLDKSKLSESPRDVAARYILKLLPIERRIIIPSLRIERNEVLLTLHRGYETNNDKKFISKPLINKNDGSTFEKQIFSYIYNHTGLYFVSKDEEYHTFLPGTLREFRTLCTVLGSFDEILDDHSDIEKLKDRNIDFEIHNNKTKSENLRLFKEYFLNTWIKDYLLSPFKKMIEDSLSISYKSWNKYFITSTVEILSKEKAYVADWGTYRNEKQKISYSNEELANIINRENYGSNISLGDFIYFLSILDKIYINDKEIKRLLFALNCWYSINLNSLKVDYEYSKINSENPELKKIEEITDIVNGTIVSKEMEIIRDTKTSKNRIQFGFKLVSDFDKTNKFLTENIFIKHDIRIKNKKYRLKEDFVNKEVFLDSNSIKNPTFNLFSFVCKDSNNIFPVPYNNMEYWYSIITKIKKDYKEGASNGILISNLFNQIKKSLDEDDSSLSKTFLNHPIIRLFLNRDNDFELSKDGKFDFVDVIYENANNDGGDLTDLVNYIYSNKEIKTKSLLSQIRKKTNITTVINFIEEYTKDIEKLTVEQRRKLGDDIKSKF